MLDVCSKYEQITTSYVSSVLELAYPKPKKEWNVDVTTMIFTIMNLGFLPVISMAELQCFIVAENIVCILKRLSLKAFLNHWVAGMIIAHYLE